MAAAAGWMSGGCSVDPPVQGHSVTPAQLTADIDQRLDELAKLPLEKRGIARKKLDKPIGARGTAAQKKRYQELMKGAPIVQWNRTPASRIRPPS